MKYKGYTSQIEVDETAGILFGKVLDIKDVITFKGNSVSDRQNINSTKFYSLGALVTVTRRS